MSITLIPPIITLILGLGLGALIGWIATRTVFAERLKTHQDGESRLREAFQALSADALRTNNEAFLTLAESRLREARTQATSDIDQRKKAIEDLLAPMARTLEQVDREVRDAERRRVESGAQLLQRIVSLDTAGQSLRDETRRLTDALKRPGVRGRWGELQLKRVVELAGMVEHCDFEEQHTFTTDERRMRPDVVVRLPGGKYVVIDAKAPLDAYLKALEAPDEASRLALLTDHARQGARAPHAAGCQGLRRPHPAQPRFRSDVSARRDVPQRRARTGPLAHRVWRRRHRAARHPGEPDDAHRAASRGRLRLAAGSDGRRTRARSASLARNLYEAVRTLGNHFQTLGTRLQSTLEAYNQSVGSLEGNVLVKARRFRELQAANGGEEIKTLEPIDKIPRLLQAPELTGGLPFHDVEEEEVQKV
jgi:DNA recombination protein RmuC